MNNRATIYDLHRMCSSREDCAGCPIEDVSADCGTFLGVTKDDMPKINQAILKWCKENPVKTYKEDFLEKFPLTRLTCDNIPSFCRKEVYNFDGSFHCDGTLKCYQCWNKSMEEEE